MQGPLGLSSREMDHSVVQKLAVSEDINMVGAPWSRTAGKLSDHPNSLLNYADNRAIQWYVIDIGYKIITAATTSANPGVDMSRFQIGLNGETVDPDFFVVAGDIDDGVALHTDVSLEDATDTANGWVWAAAAKAVLDGRGCKLPPNSYIEMSGVEAGNGLTAGHCYIWALLRAYDVGRDPTRRR